MLFAIQNYISIGSLSDYPQRDVRVESITFESFHEKKSLLKSETDFHEFVIYGEGMRFFLRRPEIHELKRISPSLGKDDVVNITYISDENDLSGNRIINLTSNQVLLFSFENYKDDLWNKCLFMIIVGSILIALSIIMRLMKM